MRSLTFNICESRKQINVDYHTLLLKTTLSGHVVKVFSEQIIPLMAEQCDLQSSPNIIRMIKSRIMRWAGHEARMGRRRPYRFLVGNPEGKRPIGRPRRRWEDNIKWNCKSDGGKAWTFSPTSRDSSVGVATRLRAG